MNENKFTYVQCQNVKQLQRIKKEKVKQNSLNYENGQERNKGSKELTNLRIRLERGEEGLKCSSYSFKKNYESSNSTKHYSLFKPSNLKAWLNCLYSNLSKCKTRVNDTQQSKLLSKP